MIFNENHSEKYERDAREKLSNICHGVALELAKKILLEFGKIEGKIMYTNSIQRYGEKCGLFIFINGVQVAGPTVIVVLFSKSFEQILADRLSNVAYSREMTPVFNVNRCVRIILKNRVIAGLWAVDDVTRYRVIFF